MESFKEVLNKQVQYRTLVLDNLNARLDNYIDGRLGINNLKKSMNTVSALSFVPSLLPTLIPKVKFVNKRCDNTSIPAEH